MADVQVIRLQPDMYSMVLGDGHQKERGELLLSILAGPDMAVFPDPGRFRDAWVEPNSVGKPVIAIYTRNGGDNREQYAEVIAKLQAHPHYLRDADDEFDSTYATFYFSTPDAWVEQLADPDVMLEEPVDTSARWHAAIEAIGGKA